MIPYHSLCVYRFVVCVWTFLKTTNLRVFFIGECISLCHPSFLLLSVYPVNTLVFVAFFAGRNLCSEAERWWCRSSQGSKRNRHLLYCLNSWLTSFVMMYILQKTVLNSSLLLWYFPGANPSMFPPVGPFPCYYFSFMFILVYLLASIWRENSFVVWTY